MRHHHGGGLGCCFELCGAPAAVYCAADAAFLCAACDAKVHGANSLASRHRRTRLLLAAAGSPAPDEDGYESAASSCVSTTDSATRAPAGNGSGSGSPSPGTRAEAVLEGWAKRTGLASGSGSDARARAAAAARALRACAHDLASARVPPRVAMAAALWQEVAGRRGIGGVGGHSEALRRLEACANVPARLVVAVAMSLARAGVRRRRATTEGWDECAWAGPNSSPARS